jgi:hypothetical protein
MTKRKVKTVKPATTGYPGTTPIEETSADETLLGLPLSFESPESGTISRAHYDPDTRQLFVDLRKSAVTYRYTAIDLLVWREFVEATSKGHYFASRIRPLYVGIKI